MTTAVEGVIAYWAIANGRKRSQKHEVVQLEYIFVGACGIDSKQSADLSSKISVKLFGHWKSGTTDGGYDFGQMCNDFRPPA